MSPKVILQNKQVQFISYHIEAKSDQTQILLVQDIPA